MAWAATNGSVFRVARLSVCWAAANGRAAQGDGVRQCHKAVSTDGMGVCQQLQRPGGEIDRWVVMPMAGLWELLVVPEGPLVWDRRTFHVKQSVESAVNL